MKTKRILIPIYEHYLILGASDSVADLNEFTKKNEKDNTDFDYSNFGAAFFSGAFGHYFIVLRTDVELTPGVIAHECKHVINGLFKTIGMNLCVDNDEAECYLLTWIVDKVWDFYTKQKIR